MLKLETPNLHEIGLDRIIAYGHTYVSCPSFSRSYRLPILSWSPLHELIPDPPLRHGHAISIDMAYSATLANIRGLLSDEEHKRLLNLFSRVGLSMDHKDFTEDVLDQATQAILKVRMVSSLGSINANNLPRLVTESSVQQYPARWASVSSSTTSPPSR